MPHHEDATPRVPRAAGPIGTDRPCIIAPLVGSTMAELEQQAATVVDSPAALVEWRADRFREADSESAFATAATRLRETLGGLPLLFTYRTRTEGGDGIADDRDYALLVETVALAGVEFIDVEYHHTLGPTVIDVASSEGAFVIASAHHFDGTPETSEMIATLEGMEAAGADVAKLAVMPRSPLDVSRLLEATARRRIEAGIPLITVAMGPLGAITRVGGEVFGSAATFASVGGTSAPGQMEAHEVASVLDLLHRQLDGADG